MDAKDAPDSPSSAGPDRRLRTVLLAVAASGMALTGAFAAVGYEEGSGLHDAESVFGGAGLATANLWILARVVSGLLPDSADGAAGQSPSGWVLVAGLKTMGLVGGTWLLMRQGVVAPLPMLVGFLSLPIGIVIGSLVSDRTHASDRP